MNNSALKPLVTIYNFEDLVYYMQNIDRYSMEITKDGLLITAQDLSVRLKVELDNISLHNNQLKLFDQPWKLVIEPEELTEYCRYLNNVVIDSNMVYLRNEQMNMFELIK